MGWVGGIGGIHYGLNVLFKATCIEHWVLRICQFLWLFCLLVIVFIHERTSQPTQRSVSCNICDIEKENILKLVKHMQVCHIRKYTNMSWTLPPLTHHCIGSTPFSFSSLPVIINHENAAYRTKLAKVRWHGNSTIVHGTWKTPPCLDPSLLLVQGAIGPHVYVLLCFMAQPGNGTWQLGDSIYMLMLEMRRKYKHKHEYKKFTQVTQWMLKMVIFKK